MILLKLEQERLLHFRRCNQLLAAALQKIAPGEALAVDHDEFRYATIPSSSSGASAALRCTPARRRDRG